MATTTALEYEPFDPQARVQVYDTYAALCDRAPVYRSRSGYYVVSRYADVRYVVMSPELYSASLNQEEGFGLPTDVDEDTDPEAMQRLLAVVANGPIDFAKLQDERVIVAADGAHHARLRGIVNRGFTPKRLAAMTPIVEGLVNEATTGLEHATEIEVAGSIAQPVAANVIAELLSIAPADRPAMKRWAEQLHTSQMGETRGSAEAVLDLMTMFKEFAEYIVPQVERRRSKPEDDLLSELVRAAEQDTLTSTEAMLFVFAMLAAGNESTASAIGNMIVALMQNPDQLALLIERPELMPGVIEESLRYRAPTQFSFRKALVDSEIAGVTIPAGSKMIVQFAAANHDPRQYPDPARFDILRAKPHIAFGIGGHFCLGAHLARLEMSVVLARMLPHLSRLRLSDDALERHHSIVGYGYRRILLVAH